MGGGRRNDEKNLRMRAIFALKTPLTVAKGGEGESILCSKDGVRQNAQKFYWKFAKILYNKFWSKQEYLLQYMKNCGKM